MVIDYEFPRKTPLKILVGKSLFFGCILYAAYNIHPDILFQTNIFGGGFLGNCSDFKLENRMYIHVCSALTERHIIYHLFNQL